VTRVLDTSVVAKWFFDEERTDRAVALLEDLLAGDARIHVPSSLFYELANVVWSRRGPTFTERQAREVWAELVTLPLSVHDESAVLPEALTFAVHHGVTVYDAVFVVLARQVGCDLVTDDRTLWKQVAADCAWVKRL